MREIVKRETIETSIAVDCSASHWATCVACIRLGASQRQFGLPERGQRKMGLPSGTPFIDSGWHEEPGLRCAAAVLTA